MGTGASVHTPEQEVEIYRTLRAEYEECRNVGKEDERELYERLRRKYHELTTQAPAEEKKVETGCTSCHHERQRSGAHGVSHEDGEKQVPRHGPTTRKRPSASQGAEDEDKPSVRITMGDVVRCRLHGEPLYYEGVVVQDYYDGNYLVDFGPEEENDRVNIADMQKVLSWDVLELKDLVEVKDQDTCMYSQAVVVAIHGDNTYDVAYVGDDEIEPHVHKSRIRKVRSNRTKASQRWQLLGNTYRAFKFLLNTPKTHVAGKRSLVEDAAMEALQH